MKLLRSQVRRISLLALFALAIQLGLSFGHFHAEGAAQAAIFADQTTTGATESATQPAAISHEQSDGLAADKCAICATIILSGTLLLAAPLALPSPAAFAIPVEASAFDFAQFDLVRTAFQSRAPPRP